MQNNDILVVAKSMNFSTLMDKNLVMASICYFGVIEEIWEVDNNASVQTNKLGFTLVDIDKVGYKGKLFIMASHE
ncbi:hypothetical protein CR513_61198, partial [Mucuna pruriens]